MGRKRGGLAGIWDRNKKVIKPLATFATGLIPGIGIPLAAGLGAAMGGFDRPGKGGIGFDVKQGALGGLQGYGMGSLGAGAKAGLGKLLGGSGSAVAQGAASPALPGMKIGVGGIPIPDPAFSNVANAGVRQATAPLSGIASKGTMGKIGERLGGAADWAEKHKVAMTAAEKAIGAMAPPQISPLAQAQADRENFELQRQKAGMGDPAQSQQLQDIIRRLMAGGGRAALATPTVPGYNNYMGR